MDFIASEITLIGTTSFVALTKMTKYHDMNIWSLHIRLRGSLLLILGIVLNWQDVLEKQSNVDLADLELCLSSPFRKLNKGNGFVLGWLTWFNQSMQALYQEALFKLIVNVLPAPNSLSTVI